MTATSNNILRWPQVEKRTGLCRSHVHSLISQGSFPEQIKLGQRASGWLESEIDQWIDDRVKESRKSSTNLPQGRVSK